MAATILITGFGPFPGAPYNPTEPLVAALARRRAAPFAHVRRVAHVFRVSYEAVDCELPALLAREKPDVLLMFGLAVRTRHMRIETRARNACSRRLPDAGGQVPVGVTIVPHAPATLPLRASGQRLVAAAQSAGVPAALSHDAGRYLCNYLCWRAAEAGNNSGPRLTAFIHVPLVRRGRVVGSRRPPLTLDDLIRAGEAIVEAALAVPR
ncbi:MAG TPA: pyroglutamyl-peptidase I [Xanthobacteraceae bacterium]|nr:pyroglutamyl-peptidase I [Xanthobacteraceae bacterium]